MKKLSLKIDKSTLKVILGALLMGLVTPLLIKHVPLLKVKLIGIPVILMLVNFCYSAGLGLWIKKHAQSGWLLYIFPLVFLLMNYLLLPKYIYYFAPIYLMIEYLCWSMSNNND